MKLRNITSTAAIALFATGFAWPAIAQQANGAAAAPSSDSKLPEVQVIQEQKNTKPKPAKQASKPKKKPSAVATAPATPPPAAEAAVEAAADGKIYEVAPGPAVAKMSPIGGSEIPIAKVPGGVSTVSTSELARTGTEYVPDALAAYVPGVILSDVQGNVFQTNVDYRGFNSSPVDGVPQGLAVYQNGVRINEAFGDTVNYDFLPTAAIQSMTIMSGNPVYGLNAIGGALSIDMKNGFTYQGFETDARPHETAP
ncbi:MAG: Plug domain-containing protein, partial [Hyphomicrobium sp.]|nr:Plug domain-containing protein [Hyphomicrobium sp.]